jgi:hypothetical protein
MGEQELPNQTKRITRSKGVAHVVLLLCCEAKRLSFFLAAAQTKENAMRVLRKAPRRLFGCGSPSSKSLQDSTLVQQGPFA